MELVNVMLLVTIYSSSYFEVRLNVKHCLIFQTSCRVRGGKETGSSGTGRSEERGRKAARISEKEL
jgi:hypothetical protein